MYARSLPEKRVEELLTKAMKQTERYRLMKEAGASEQQIRKAFDTPEEMTVFSWKGDKDTIMTPMDSIRYYKSFLRTGFMSMDPANGHVKAYVGGPNYVYFQYDMAMVGRRQVGSTIKPYLYTLAMENGFSPCDQARHVEQTLIDENGTPAGTEKLIKLVYDPTDSTYRVATASDAKTTYVMTAGDITIKGLDDSEDYYLYETKAPAGYNRLTEPVKFRISATYTSADSRPDVLTKVGDGAAFTGLKVSVENNAGTTLPSTGGMGTTVFYVVGGGLMAVAVVLLVTKKRMENKR